MSEVAAALRKPRALWAGSKVAVFAPASPAEQVEITAGIAELKRLDFQVDTPEQHPAHNYFAGSREERMQEFCVAVRDQEIAGLVAARGGYGSNYLLEADLHTHLDQPKCVIGFSDLTALQTYLWQVCGWVTFYGPMAGAGFNYGAQASRGYDKESFLRAIRNTAAGWEIDLDGETLVTGAADGRLLGGCLTLLQATLGTPWELETAGSILLLEDRGMKPYQVDRALMHLKQAGKFSAVRGIVLGEFPESDPDPRGVTGVHEVCERILGPLGVPIVYGAPVGHAKRAMLTVPLGVRARLEAKGQGFLEVLEPAVVD
jgi:muramoyltetrapeptide carboxypeptidase